MDILEIIIFFSFFTVTFLVAIINAIDFFKEKKRQEKLEERRIAENRKRTFKFFCEQGEYLENV